jgi:hypothetical protein
MKTLIVSLALFSSVASAAQDVLNAEPLFPVSRNSVSVLVGNGATSATPVQNSIESLEAAIISVARANTTRLDNLRQIRAELEPLVGQLLALVPDVPENQDAQKVAGAWKSEWSDLFTSPNTDLTMVYQVVSPLGFYYNISRSTFQNGEARANFLRGAYVDQGQALAIEFTSDSFAPAWLPAGADLVTIASLAESGFLQLEPDPTSRAVGRRGILRNVYVSDTLRIVTGNSETRPESLFVLTRADRIPFGSL